MPSIRNWTILFFVVLVTSQSIKECTVTFNSNLLRQSDSRLLGYNTVLGPVDNLTYFDEGLILSSNMLYNGILRYPGGTVANYWTMKNASYVQPCNTSQYDYCKQQAVVAKLPPQTFSPANFSKGIGITSPVTKDKRNAIVFDINLLTLSNQTLLDEINILYSEVGNNVKYIELGNEYYLNKYQYEFPNSTVYMNKAVPVINYIRKVFGNTTKISVPSSRAFPGTTNEWNNQLTKFKQYYDSVTVHDYSLKQELIENLTAAQQKSFISIYGRSVIPQWIEYVQNEFGNDKTIFMTEYNTKFSNESFSYTVLHAMFVMSYVTAAICDETKTMELLLMQLYASQIGNEHGKYQCATVLSAKANDTKHTTFDIVGQILAQISYIAMMKNNQMTCLDFSNSGNGECPLLGMNVVGNSKLQCLYGSGFNNNKNTNSFGFVVINSCQYSVNMKLDIMSITKLNKNVQLDIYQYAHQINGGSNAKFVDCKENVWDKSCAAVYANYKQVNITANQQTLSLNINAMSTIVASVV